MWQLTANVVSPLEHKVFENGSIDTLRVATFGGYRINEAKEKVELTTWITVHVKDNKNINLARGFKKGDRISLTGYVKLAKPYKSKKDKTEHSAITFVADHVLLA